MTELSRQILERWQVRNTKQQKTDFIQFLQEQLPGLRIEEGGLSRSRNLILGDPDSARVVFSAHYDTCTVLPFPNFLTPKNIFIYLFINLALAAVVFALVFAVSFIAAKLFHNFWISYFSSLLTALLCLLVLIAGKPNPHTVNDNTSGVITLCELYQALDDGLREKAAFVFFDHEEAGLFGSRFFLKKHKQAMKEKLLLNLDCVSDGDTLMLIENRQARSRWGQALESAFAGEHCPAGKTVLLENSSRTLYPSDQLGFPCYTAAAAFRRSKWVGLYLSRIHTKKDTVLQEENILFLRDGGKRLLERLE